MDKTRNIWPWLLCILLDTALLAGVWLCGYHCGKKATAQDMTADGTAVSRTETVTTAKATAPEPASTRPSGAVAVHVRLEAGEPAEPTDMPGGAILVYTPSRHEADTLAGNDDTAFSDSVRAVVPLTQKEYRDSNYTAWVSGFMPKLDSIEVRSKVITIRETTTKRSRLNVGLTGGMGYGVLGRRPDVFIGVGVTWSLFR